MIRADTSVFCGRCGLALLAAWTLALDARAAGGDGFERLVAAYRTAPGDYPSGADSRGIPYALCDVSVPFRWHSFDERSAARFADAAMDILVEPYNPCEDGGISVPYQSPMRFAFVTEHATEGTRCVRADYPGAEIAAGRARVLVGVAPGARAFYPASSGYSRTHPAAAYWSHYRRLAFDAHNPLDEPVRIRANGVPFALPPGTSVVAVRTPDAASANSRGAHSAQHIAVEVEAIAPRKDLSLYLDNFRMEQEVPRTIRRNGRLFHFAAHADPDGDPILWPGFTPVRADELYTAERGFGWTGPATRRRISGLSFRSLENGIVWGRCSESDAPFRVDLPNGRWGVHLFATPTHGFDWSKGASVTLNGKEIPIFPPRAPEEVRRMALDGERWDYRPGAAVWEELVRGPYFPRTAVLAADVSDGALLLEWPKGLLLRWIAIFPENDRAAALRELGRIDYLLAESWDVSHAWLQGAAVEKLNYIGGHEEASRPETVPARLRALGLAPADFARGFLLFHRGLVEAVYPDTVPSPAEAAPRDLRGFTAPAQRTTLAFGLLPLRDAPGLRFRVEPPARNGKRLDVDLRFSQYRQKCMEYGHHNHAYNYQEHFLVKREALDLAPAAARRGYLLVAAPPDAQPGEYRGGVTIVSAEGATLASLPVTIEVLPLALDEPDVYFGTESSDAVMREFGFNLSSADYDQALSNGFRAFAVWPYDATRPAIAGRRVGWSTLVEQRDFFAPLIEAGRDGRGMRLFFGGPFPEERSLSAADGRRAARESAERLLAAFPRMEIPGITMPTFYYIGPQHAHSGPVWERQTPTRGKSELLEEAGRGDKPFWFVDWLRHSKEQPARFTFGFWLWKLQPFGRFTTFTYGWDYAYGTAKETYRWEPWYTLLGVVGANAHPAAKESLDEGLMNPSRDLALLGEGIGDYRYARTLARLVREAEAANRRGPASAAARRFLDELAGELSLDLDRYYTCRNGAYAENWFARPDNPWTTEKFDATRRACAMHIVALTSAAPAAGTPATPP